MMTSSRFEVRREAPNSTTRPNGVAARAKLRSCLDCNDQVIVDLSDVVLTPSFADEFLGVLVSELGAEQFRRTVQVINVSTGSRALLNTIFSRRLKKPDPNMDRHQYA